MGMDCNACNLLKKKEAEIAALKKEQELLFLLLDLGLIAVERWARDNGLLPSTDTKPEEGFPNGNDQVGMLLNQVRESSQEISLDGLVRILKSL